ncbi:MAG: amino acid ABC transporter permease [Clostridia bacterium]|nr:amino acid ABC transporter permease [Clostridia bacterium]MDD6041799.1 amino acid ABC transporter permease [Clostridia bacterium]
MEQFWQSLVKEFTRTFITDNRWLVFWNGFKNTVLITVVAALIGIAIGVVVSVVHYLADSIVHKKKRKGLGEYIVILLDKLLTFYVSVMRGTPLAIQLTIMAFIVMAGFPNKVIVCCVAFGINSGAYVSEVIRGGINSVDIGQMEAGRSVGLSQIATMRLIILPQAIKNILPALCNEGIAVLKETSIVGLISVVDLTRASDLVRSRTLSPYFPLIVVAIVYYILVAGLSAAVSRLERRMAQSDRH